MGHLIRIVVSDAAVRDVGVRQDDLHHVLNRPIVRHLWVQEEKRGDKLSLIIDQIYVPWNSSIVRVFVLTRHGINDSSVIRYVTRKHTWSYLEERLLNRKNDSALDRKIVCKVGVVCVKFRAQNPDAATFGADVVMHFDASHQYCSRAAIDCGADRSNVMVKVY